ncbi:MAG: ADP-ribosylglycohydrolase family protein [Armatimonadota bacterium]|nr:ADP-ribosylglycohydrolase family protein [bacterium]
MLELSYSAYHDKVLGCWQGKCIGGSFGAPVEGAKSTNDLKFYASLDKAQIANDDLDIQLVWVHAFKEHGLDLTSHDLMQEWMSHVLFPWNEYGYAMKNFRTGIRPPLSGAFNNSYFGESMGCPIRSEIWGLVAPGDPELAASYAEKDAVLDHYGNSVYAEKLLAAIESMAFIESDPKRLLETGLSFIPANSRLAQCIRFVIECHEQSMPMLETRTHMINRFGHPDATSAVQNLGIIAIGLLYGEGDFERSMVSAVNCGYDSDCTGATVGAIMGVILGSHALPEKWVTPIGDDIISLLKIEELLEESTIQGLTNETCRFGVALSQRSDSACIIHEVPADVTEKAAAIAGRAVDDVSVQIEYPGSPSVSFSEPAKVFIKVVNNRERTIDTRLHLTGPSHLDISIDHAEVTLPPKESAGVEVLVVVKDGVTDLPIANKIRVTCSYEDKNCNEEFGLAGASEWQVIGPFWDTFPVDMVKPCSIYPHEDPSLPPVELMFMNHAGFDREYLPEPGFSEIRCDDATVERVTVDAPEDKVPLDDIFTMAGPQVVYMIRKIRLEQPRRVWVLTSGTDGVKLWINGKELINCHEHVCENPSYHFAEAELNAGVNTIAAKVIRCGSSFRFSLAIKENDGKHWHQQQHFIDYSNVKVCVKRNLNRVSSNKVPHVNNSSRADVLASSSTQR